MNLRQAQRALADVMAMCQEAHVQLPIDPLDGLYEAAQALRHSKQNDKLELKDALEELTQVFGIDPVFQQHQKEKEQKRFSRQKRGRKPNDTSGTKTATGIGARNASAPGSKSETKPPRKPRTETIKEQNPARNSANQEIADEFVDLGGYELTHGENQKGISRMRAAKQIRNLPEPITSGAQAREIPGIGPSAAAKVDEILHHGKMRALEDIESSLDDKDAFDDM